MEKKICKEGRKSPITDFTGTWSSLWAPSWDLCSRAGETGEKF